LADDGEDIRDYLCEIIANEHCSSEHDSNEYSSMEVIGTAANSRDAIELVDKLLPDIVLMDIQMETRTAGIDAIEIIRSKHPEIKCIVITIHEDDEYLFQAYLVGAADYIIKTSEPDKIIKSIYDVNTNQLLLRPEVAQKIMREYRRIQSTHSHMRNTLQVMMKVSTAEYEILRLIYDGHSYRSIAKLRCVEETTIRSQVNHILKKFKKKRMKEVIAELRASQIFE